MGPVSGPQGNRSCVKTQFSQAQPQNLIVLGPRQYPSLIGPASGLNSLGSCVRTQCSWVWLRSHTQREYIKLGPAQHDPFELDPAQKDSKQRWVLLGWTHQPWLLLQAGPISVGPVSNRNHQHWVLLLTEPNAFNFFLFSHVFFFIQ